MKPLLWKAKPIRCFVLTYIFTLNFILAGNTQTDEFWGMTRYGGTGNGVIFKTNNTGDAYTIVHHFSGPDGSFPEGSLTWFNGKLYGMTNAGGATGLGVIFEIDPSTQPATFTKKIEFDDINGAGPSGSFTVFNNQLWGLTKNAGPNNLGNLFKYEPSTNTCTSMYEFPLGSSSTLFPNGRNPYGDLTVFNGKLYGMTHSGGVRGDGVIFEYDPTSGTFANRFSFDQSTPTFTGAHPFGSLTVFNNKLYGMTSQGGSNNNGSILEFDPSTNPGTYTRKASFISSLNGSVPSGNITVYNNKFYGMTRLGGNSLSGIIFEYDPANTNPDPIVKLFDFVGENGNRPNGSLLLYNNKFYGLTTEGGFSGVLFEFTLPNNYLIKHSFGSITNDGGSPEYTTIIVAPTGCVATTWYRDNDGDTYGSAVNTTTSCTQPAGYVSNSTDCDDNNAALNPGVSEVCDGIDNNCNSFVDEDLSETVYYKDLDGDSYGNPSTSVQRCSQPLGWVTNNGDCNDNNAAINPGATEICGNSVDENCNGMNDDVCNPTSTITIDDIAVVESQGLATFTITLSSASIIDTRVTYKTINGTATSMGRNKDFKAVNNGNVIIPAGSTTATISIVVYADDITEQSEYFNVQLTKTTNGTIADNLGWGTITEFQNKTILNQQSLIVDVFPNPAPDNFLIVPKGPGKTNAILDIKIYDATGKVIDQVKVPSSKTSRIGNNLKPGIYFAEVIHGTNRQLIKLIKM